MEVYVTGGGISNINLGRIIKDDSDDTTMNDIEYVGTYEITITKITVELVEEGTGEAE